MTAFDLGRLRKRVSEFPFHGWRGQHALLAKIAAAWIKDKAPLDIAPWLKPYDDSPALEGVPPGLRNKPRALQLRYLRRRAMFAHMAGAS